MEKKEEYLELSKNNKSSSWIESANEFIGDVDIERLRRRVNQTINLYITKWSKEYVMDCIGHMLTQEYLRKEAEKILMEKLDNFTTHELLRSAMVDAGKSYLEKYKVRDIHNMIYQANKYQKKIEEENEHRQKPRGQL